MSLVSTKEMLLKAYKEKYAVGAFNVDTVEIMQAVLMGAERAKSPVIIAVSGRMLPDVPYIVQAAQAASREFSVPIALHLDHGKSAELCKRCIDSGFTSVMIDASAYDFSTNIAITKDVVQYAHAHGVSVESELGVIAGKEEDMVVAGKYGIYTRPDDAEKFVSETGVDSLAVSIGTSHGVYKFSADQTPSLRFDILQEITDKLPNFPIVLHGASSIPQDRLAVFNQYGGKIKQGRGIPEDMLRQATKRGVCKINVASDVRICYFGELRRQFALHPDKHDSHEFLIPARNAVAEMVYGRILSVMGSQNKA